MSKLIYNRNIQIQYTTFPESEINLGKELYFGTGAGKRLLKQNRNLQISIVTKKDSDQVNFIKAFVTALEGEDYCEYIPDNRQRGIFQNLFKRQSDKSPQKDYRSNRIRCFFIDDFKSNGNKPYNLHTKLYIVDNTDLFFGSFNFDDGGFLYNLESSMQTSDPIVISKMTEYYDEIVNGCIKDSI